MDQDKYLGRLLDNRYEIQEVLGVGGMAVVYKARCHRLNRPVAIKILKDELSNDEEFRRRFHGESQAVAMLSHPNIVSVYDVASTNEINYIVMELIDGITLKQYMEKKGVLNWKETLHFAIQIAKALEHAHSRGLVHRDIKPHNVMVLKNGSVKVTDFGIARVMAKSNTLTKEALGSVHYISPEQAKGGRVDSRSDIYSLGVVMYEMIAGRPPYDGESPVSVAIQHINGGAKMPSTINPNIPGGLEQIIMKAMAHDPAQRYVSATAMLYDMDEFRKEPTMLFDYNTPPIDAVTQISAPPPVQPESVPPRTTAERVAAKPQRERGAASAKTANRNTGAGAARRRREESERRQERSNRVATVAIISCSIVAVIAIGLLLWAVMNGDFFVSTPPEDLLKVPDLVNRDYETLNKNAYPGFTIVLGEYVNSEEVAAGKIISQEPEAGLEVSRGNKIVVVVSLGPKTHMENLVGLDRQNAVNYLMGQGIPENLILIREEYSDAAVGKVTKTDPLEGEEIPDGTTVTIWVSLGREIVTQRMPNVVGKLFEEAKQELNNRGFMDVTEEPVDSNEPKGTVLEQSAEKYKDTDVTTPIILKVSKGPEEKVVPNVVGKTYDEAYDQLTEAGFLDVTREEVESLEPIGQVIHQSVEAQTMLEVTSPIVLQVSKGPRMEKMPNVVGKTYDEALAELNALGFTEVTPKEVYSDVAVGQVVGQSVTKNNQIAINTPIELEVSMGPQKEEMPDLMGKTIDEAVALLVRLGFTQVKRIDIHDNAPVGQVIGQSVEKGTEITLDTIIELRVSLGPAAPETVSKTVTIDLTTLFPEPAEEPFSLELQLNGERVYFLDACTQLQIEVNLEGFGIQYFDIYVDEIYWDSIRVDFNAQ